MARKGSNQPENTEPEKSASHQPDKQEVLSDPVNPLPDEKDLKGTPKIVVSNLGTNAGWSAGTKALSQKKARNGCPIQRKGQEKTDIIEKRLESLEKKGFLLGNNESNSKDLERKVGKDDAKEVKKSKYDKKNWR